MGQLITFHSLLVYFLDPVKNLINLQPQMQTAVVAAERLGEILDLEVEKGESEGQKMKPRSLLGDIEFKNVNFRYGTRKLVLEDVNLQIAQGQNVAFVVESYVENNDIAKIRDGMEVIYEVGAYPSREYGKMMGEVTFVSADLKVNNSGSAYYMVETSVDTQTLHNKAGEAAVLKVGMLCETKIVIEQRRVLEVLVEKLFHMGE